MRLECDAIQVVRLIKREEEDDIELSFFIKEAQNLLSLKGVESISHVPRAHNQMTHILARKAYEDDTSSIWVNSFPNWLLSANTEDVGSVYHSSGGFCPTG